MSKPMQLDSDVTTLEGAYNMERHSEEMVVLTPLIVKVQMKPFTVNHPGPWKETTGLEIEGFPRQLYGNDCGVFLLMVGSIIGLISFSVVFKIITLNHIFSFIVCPYTILDAPYDFTIIDMPALRKWWCVMLMENFDLGSHG
ncbi:hypothetical protein F7725_025677 [Dissostichus mawsoni]|uniref:Uncharacterized protein n=1 Tax=Dissostichus mawsoni TaxID=36200 RepID=A0A7J5XCB2_DISMA|nr:hypothetical protein F7725_025677 [Dissostichus mawsoni]